MRQWYKLAQHARWQSLQELRADLPQADGVMNKRGETLTVFNIWGNKYRLVARVRYDCQLINIRDVLTHADYDKGKWRIKPWARPAAIRTNCPAASKSWSD
ncbi:MAG: type II toxin-antitoxin system HigB family toxin [Phycisphaeraceae bacterium]